MGRADPRRPQPPFRHLRRRHRPLAASGDQRGPRPPAISPGDHQGRAPEEEMQRSMNLFSAACENFGLVINTQKTVVMHQPPPNSATAPNAPPQISVNGTQLQVVENFPYLGSTLAPNTKIDDEVANTI
nr:unnamed protein product [Spirometra erinaceieuropaei]